MQLLSGVRSSDEPPVCLPDAHETMAMLAALKQLSGTLSEAGQRCIASIDVSWCAESRGFGYNMKWLLNLCVSDSSGHQASPPPTPLTGHCCNNNNLQNQMAASSSPHPYAPTNASGWRWSWKTCASSSTCLQLRLPTQTISCCAPLSLPCAAISMHFGERLYIR